MAASCISLMTTTVGALAAEESNGAQPAPVLMAQAATPAATPATPAPAKTASVETVTVTARKREEKLVEVPISMQAFTAEKLKSAGLVTLSDIADQAGFTFQEGVSTAAAGRTFGSIIFRGLQSTYGAARENSGSLFVDGIFMSGGQSSIGTSDVARVEVLKGPQNVLFGRNTFGGAVNYITKNPSDTFGGALNVSGTSRGSTDMDLTVEGPLIKDQLTGRLTANLRNKTAEYHTSDGGDLGAEKTTGITGTLYATPTDKLWLRFRGHYQQDDDSAAAVGFLPGATYGQSCANNTYHGTTAAGAPVAVKLTQLYFCGGKIPSFGQVGVGSLDQNIAVPAVFQNAILANTLHDNFLAEVPQLTHSGLRRDVLSLAAQGGYELPAGFSASVNAGYNEALSNTFWDLDRAVAPYFFESQPVENHDYTIDAKIQSDQSARLRGLVGASYFMSRNQSSQIDFGVFTNNLPALSANYIDDESRVAAGYASVDFDIFPFLTATAEARYQTDDLISRTRSGLRYTNSSDSTLPRFILKYHPNETSNFYVSYSEGVQPTQLNSAFASATPAQQAYIQSVAGGVALFSPPPKLESYEIGAKQSLFDGRFQYSIAAYDEKWTGQLTAAAVFNPGGCSAIPPTLTGASCPLSVAGSILYLPNNAEIKGLEFAGDVKITPKWGAGVTVDYKDTKWTQFYNSTLAGFAGGTSYFTGNELSRVPAVTGTFNTTYNDHLIGPWDWHARADVIYTGSMWESDINIAKTNAFTRVNARIGIDKGDLTLEVFATNLTNNKDWNLASRVTDLSSPGALATFARQGVLVIAPDKPEFGLRAGYKF